MTLADLQSLAPERKWEIYNAAAWKVGRLRHHLLPGAQRSAYDKIDEWEKAHPDDPGPLVLHLHRSAGKSAGAFIYALQRAVKYSGEMIRIGGPTKIETEGIFDPIIRMVTSWRPAAIQFEKVKDEYRVQNPAWGVDTYSTIQLFGCRELAEGQRGFRANLIMIDEARNIDRLGYIVREVLGPQLGRKDRPLVLLWSTSPRRKNHEFWDFVDEANKEGRYLKIGVDDNPDFSARDRKVLVRICGGDNTVAWRREALCAREQDESLAALPSFSRNRERIVLEVETPKYYFPYVFSDMGFVDATAILFAYVHYALQKLVVIDEIVVVGKGTDQLADLIKEKECLHFKPTERDKKGHHWDELLRWADDTRRGLEDFEQHGLHFAPARKGEKAWHKWRGLANLESAFFGEEILIHPRCKSFIYQCENATRNDQQTDLMREKPRDDQDPDDPLMGHADAVWAAAYGLWQTKHLWLESPLPPAPQSFERFVIPKKIRDTNVKAERGIGENITYGPIRVLKGIR